jgi:uncharacterized protein
MHYFYLHGFASSPRSRKAQDLRDRFAQSGRSLITPDLNQDDFSHLTLSRQIQQVQAALPQTPVTVLGSSLGGLTAAWVGQHCPQVTRLVLLAPAFGFLNHWLPLLGAAQLHQWQTSDCLSVFHHGAGKPLPLHYGFVEDCRAYDDRALRRPVPTLILHGHQDAVIPIDASITFARDRSWVQLIALNSDHGLLNVSAEIWGEIATFCALLTPETPAA